jgi:FAD:protein FMN transferase
MSIVHLDALSSPRRRAVIGALGAASLLAACGRAQAPSALEFEGLTMGSRYRVKIIERGVSPALAAAARDAVAAALGAVDKAMSTFRPQSELSRFNAHASTAAVPLSPALFSVLSLARQVSQGTQGAFDVTVGPLVDAWGFGPGRRTRVLAEAEVGVLGRRVDWRQLHLDERAGSVAKSHPQVRADLSGIAKGYGVDQAARALDLLGLEHYLIDAGGEVRTRGHNLQGNAWQVAIEQPVPGPRRPRYVVPLSGLAIATSGDYRIFFERDGRRYSHEINPATGQPVSNPLTSVSVVADSGALADALGKLIVLGPEKAYALAADQHVAAHFIVREPDGSLRDIVTPAFAALGGRPLHL